MKIITTDDFVETYVKLVQRGPGFLASKFRIRDSERTLSAFDNSAVKASNWWSIPNVRRRWNEMISGEEDTSYEDYVNQKYLEGRKDLKMLSLGSGSCSHEIHFARHHAISMVKCIDIADNLLEKARLQSRETGLSNMVFIQGDAHGYDMEVDYYDVILFHASLHHFKNIDRLIGGKLVNALNDDGILVINEYVGPNRLQFPREQIRAVNRALKIIPESYRRRYRLNLHKSRVSGPGILRMIMADPSEAIESAGIMDTLEKYFEKIEEKPYGGNVLMLALKDISHHFLEETDETKEILQSLFDLEDEYLLNAKSDFVFAVYGKRK